MVAQGLWIRQTVGRSRKDSPTKAGPYLLSAMDGSPTCAFCKLRYFGNQKKKEKKRKKKLIENHKLILSGHSLLGAQLWRSASLRAPYQSIWC